MSYHQEVEKISGIECHWNIDLTSYSTFRLKSQGDLVIVRSENALAQLLPLLTDYSRKWRMLGWGANQILAEREKDLLIKLDFSFDDSLFNSPHESYQLPASAGLSLLVSHAIKFNLKGWEVLTGIPASLGGAIIMNAGTALGEIGSIVRSVRIMDSKGMVRTHVISPGDFSYRKNHFVHPGEVVVGATLFHHGVDPEVSEKIRRYHDYRKQTQPLTSKNCGCVFKNASTAKQAGRLIDLTGLKGFSVGALKVSSKHANFMENTGGASEAEFHQLASFINDQIELYWGVRFELEVKSN